MEAQFRTRILSQGILGDKSGGNGLMTYYEMLHFWHSTISQTFQGIFLKFYPLIPTDELHHFSRWLLHHQPVMVYDTYNNLVSIVIYIEWLLFFKMEKLHHQPVNHGFPEDDVLFFLDKTTGRPPSSRTS